MNAKAVIVIKDDAGAYLAHHGVEGQRWGHRNGPPYPLDSSMSTGKSLKEEARAKKREEKAERYKSKHLAKIEKEHRKISERYAKQSVKNLDKMNDAVDKNNAKKLRKIVERGQQLDADFDRQRILNSLEYASLKNYTVEDVAKEKREKGAAVVASILGSAASVAIARGAGIPIALLFLPNMRNLEKAKRLDENRLRNLSQEDIYKAKEIMKTGEDVINKMLGTKLETTGKEILDKLQKEKLARTNMIDKLNYTPERQKQKLDYAKKTGNYDLTFLESIQSTKMEYDGNTAQINKAYKEYLKDPDKFISEVNDKYETV